MTTGADVMHANPLLARTIAAESGKIDATPTRLLRAARAMRSAHADAPPFELAGRWRSLADRLLEEGRGFNAAHWLRACADIVEREGLAP